MTLSPEEIKYYRASLGLTQAELAEQMSVSTQTVSYWERGHRNCSPSHSKLLLLLHEQAWRAGARRRRRPKYVDLAPGDWEAASAYDWCELKYDGEYGELHGGPDGWRLLSRGGHEVDCGPEPLPRCCILMEQIRGTEWARKHAPSETRGKLVMWSALGAHGRHLPPERFGLLMERAWQAMIPIARRAVGYEGCPIDSPVIAVVWEREVVNGSWEGLIFRTHGGKFARMKRRVTRDYVCMGVEANDLTGATSIIGGLYNGRGKLVRKVSVPWMEGYQLLADQIDFADRHGRGGVFEASGLAILESGALRNPRFERWRPDKPAEECTT
jgi:transcriptional regulator with XRE-family HTH domain